MTSIVPGYTTLAYFRNGDVKVTYHVFVIDVEGDTVYMECASTKQAMKGHIEDGMLIVDQFCN